MLARTNKLAHPLGIQVETPLLVPSFSSKGFAFEQDKKNNIDDLSEVFEALEVSKEFLTESMLISAYDIYYKHVPFNENYICTDLTFIDSGGYETGANYDLSTITKYNYDVKEWDESKLIEVLNGIPSYNSSVIISFDTADYRVPLREQVDNALKLFSNYPKMMGDFLIKPETKDQKYVQMANIIASIKEIKKFPIIGVTERELGSSFLERMLNVANIRRALDNEDNKSPIHIFGSLDPLTSILYFLAGAEIFDGLTWLRYSYHNGRAVYISNYGIINPDLGIHLRDSQVKIKSMVNNIYFLEKMKYNMKDFVKSKNFELFDQIGCVGFGKMIEKIYSTFEANLR